MVNISKLMIGDWVKTNPSCGKLVCDIKSNIAMVSEIGFSNSDGMYVTLVGTNGRYYDDELEPIQLTDEILEKNGFEKYDGGGYIIKELTDDEMPSLYIWDGNYSLCVVDFYSSNRYTDIKNCKYVHELQHELKSCGIVKSIKL